MPVSVLCRSRQLLSHMIASLSVSNYPVVLVATKCDNPEELRELDTASVAAAYPSVVANFTTSPNTPNTTRDCLQVILRAVVSGRKGTKLHGPHPCVPSPSCFYSWTSPRSRCSRIMTHASLLPTLTSTISELTCMLFQEVISRMRPAKDGVPPRPQTWSPR